MIIMKARTMFNIICLTHSMCSIKTGKMKGGRKGRRQGRSEGGKKRGRENPDFYISLYCALPTSSVDPCSKLSRYVGSCLPQSSAAHSYISLFLLLEAPLSFLAFPYIASSWFLFISIFFWSSSSFLSPKCHYFIGFFFSYKALLFSLYRVSSGYPTNSMALTISIYADDFQSKTIPEEELS